MTARRLLFVLALVASACATRDRNFSNDSAGAGGAGGATSATSSAHHGSGSTHASGSGTGGATGTGGGTGSGTGGANCGAPAPWIPDPACKDCAKNSCCNELAACDAACMAFGSCIETCSDLACTTACGNPVSGPEADAYLAVLNCVEAQCCVPDNGICGLAVATGYPPCDNCMGANCCAEWLSCQDPSCTAALEGCINNGSTDPMCVGNSMAQTVYTCMKSSCPGVVCPLGPGP